jgi:SAM-dependent methyltransferase
MSSGGPVESCRSCGHDDLRPVVSLGETPIANALVDPTQAEMEDRRFPLDVVFCPRCSLVQLGYALPADVIFGDEYPYFSSYSQALVDHARRHVADLVATRRLDARSFVVEVASNDGYLLQHLVGAGVRVLGIDPAPGPAAAAEAIGVPSLVAFFGVETAKAVRADHGPADVIVANNVMAHVPDLNDFVGGMAVLLADDGLMTIENPYVRDLVQHVEFDTIYHEHYCYFSCSAVDRLMARHGLHLNDVEYFPELHGGTLRWHVNRLPDRTDRCAQLLTEEQRAGMHEVAYYARFSDRVRESQVALQELLEGLRARGRTVAAYGAAAKGATLLNSTGIGRDLVSYVVDRNVHKQGKLMPGCRLPIRPVDVLMQEPPDDVLILAWNFTQEIMSEQRAYAEAGGTFYVPLPTPEPVGHLA